MRIRFRYLAAAALVAGWALTPTVGRAQENSDEGVIRVTDAMHPSAMPPGGGGQAIPQGYGGPGCPSGHCPGGYGSHWGGLAGACPHGCPSGRCSHGYGCHGWGWGCNVCGCLHHTVYGALSWLNHGPPCTYSPDHGWAPPGRLPHRRVDVVYGKAFPNAWTGQPAPVGAYRAPLVYMPTDTTQLGYYYQKVPYWMPNHAMIPPTPNPAQWHVPLCGLPPAGAVAGEIIGPAGSDVQPAPSAPSNGEAPPATPGNMVPPPPADPLEKTARAPQLMPIPR